MNILAVLFGGGAGAVSRYLLSRLISEHSTAPIPMGTLTVNLIGSFLIGFFFQAFKNTTASPALRLLVTTGFLGGFTTFSTFALETVTLAEERELGYTLLNLLLHNAIGLAAVILGMITFSVLKSILTGVFHA
ncbi:fluoride efflux transporter CrcB [Gracilinema caldarium]|uniref:fluoride efflux transporter CrcB n=1 Tax=Gracilinema caldarium TaxID=215591 RepID=UPI0026F0822D|nr:fluoride efflux transporter CrcB [Gracilinema caldarium]